ncbi:MULTISPECIES: DUF4040 family protein [unclassified Nocardiopsis]|uniref:DUF4040 family protein n=1 Tax=unclassified Nocardiopsis TaxID=2649073 RepID=UPI00135A0BA4|nr:MULTISPECIES: DUF4040 family protein [unclassified Nocardiopsis]
MLHLLAALVAVTLLAPAVDRVLGRSTGWLVAGALALLTGLVLLGGGRVLEGERPPEAALSWMPTLGVGLYLRMDGLAWLFCVLVLGVGALVLAYSARYFPPGGQGGFFFAMSAFATAMTGLVLADDVVLLFVCWELTTVCSFWLIGLPGAEGARPAVRAFLPTAMGGLALLTAVLLLWTRTGTTRLSVIVEDSSWTRDTGFATVVALLVVVAVLTKSAQFPFHAWLPDAMVAATPVSAYLHAAAMVKAGVYVAMRFSPAFADVVAWQVALVGLGLLTAVMGAVFALQKNDIKELVAYSTISQLGLIVAAVGVGTAEALVAAAMHTLAHALFKAALFMAVGVVDHQTHTRDLRELGGLRRSMPITTATSALAALSMAGIPPLLGFVSKEGLLEAFLHAPGPVWAGPVAAGAAVVASALTFAYAFRFVYPVFGGRVVRNPEREPSREAPWSFVAWPALAAAGGLVLGPAVSLLNPLAGRIAEETARAGGEADLALWHGFTPALGMSAAAVLLGALLAWRTSFGAVLAGRRLFPVRGTEAFERLYAGVVALGERTGDLTRTDAPVRHLAAPIVLVLVLAAVVAGAGLDYGVAPAPVVRPQDWVLVALLTASVSAAVLTRSRIAALVLVGTAGFTTALWFLFLGAFDVALTQLLVEVLTVVVAVLVLRRLPRGFHAVRRARTVATGAVAVAAGLAAGLAAYALTGRRELSPVGDYLLSNAREDTGGTNVVNTVLVDYRALDTLGELTVLGAAGLIVIAVLHSAGLSDQGRVLLNVPRTSPVWDSDDNTVAMRTVARWLIPLLLVWSLYLLLRGHDEPGGGFIAGLVGGAGFALAYLASSSASVEHVRRAYPIYIACGVALALGAGLLGYAEGSFLRPLHFDLLLPWGGFSTTTALVFDAGIYLAVVGVVLTALNQLGLERPVERSGRAPDARERGLGGGR